MTLGRVLPTDILEQICTIALSPSIVQPQLSSVLESALGGHRERIFDDVLSTVTFFRSANARQLRGAGYVQPRQLDRPVAWQLG